MPLICQIVRSSLKKQITIKKTTKHTQKTTTKEKRSELVCIFRVQHIHIDW